MLTDLFGITIDYAVQDCAIIPLRNDGMVEYRGEWFPYNECPFPWTFAAGPVTYEGKRLVLFTALKGLANITYC
jgi:hypothetical protein